MRRSRIEAGWRLGVAIVTVPAAVSGCLSPTDITLDITSDLPCSKLAGVAISAGPHGIVEVQPPNAIATTCSGRDGGASFGTLVLTPHTSADTEITVLVVAGVSPTNATSCTTDNDYEGCIVVRRVLHYEEHTELTLPIEAHASCSEVRCIGEDATCVDGVCLPSKIDDPSRCVGDGCTQAKLFDGVKSPGCLGDQGFAVLGTLPGIPSSFFGALSADGRVVFGYSSTVDGSGEPVTEQARPFRCSSGGERTPVAGPHGRPFVPRACDKSGSVMVGYDVVGGEFEAARWSAGEAAPLPTARQPSEAYGCDVESCTKIVGQAADAPVLWRSPSHDPARLRGAVTNVGYASGIEPNGRYAFGNSLFVAGFWDVPANEWHPLGVDTQDSSVNAATPDGAILIGFSTGAGPAGHAVLWKAKERWATYEARALGPVPAGDTNCGATGISDDGSVVTGLCGPARDGAAALWEARSGFAPVLLADRVAVPAGWKLISAVVSADGTIVAGTAVNGKHERQVYVARLK